MKQYIELGNHVLNTGNYRGDRTGTGTISVFGYQTRFDLQAGFPLLTTKKMFLKGIIDELLWFLQGDTNNNTLNANGVNIWNEWATEDGELGPIYGKQWRSWQGKVLNTNVHVDEPNGAVKVDVYRETFDQITDLIEGLKNKPFSRRHIVSAWNVEDLPDESISPQENVKNGKMALAPCFTKRTFVNTQDGYNWINLIKPGDYVLSGTGIPRRVNHVWETPYQGKMYSLKLMYKSKKIECTPNHPFLVKDKGWVSADKLKVNDLLAISKPKNRQNHIFNYSINHGFGHFINKTHELTIDDYFTLGYFLGNGWANPLNARVCFAIPHSKKDIILERIRRTIKVNEKPGPNINVATYQTDSVKWINILREFGYMAHNKRIPEWIITSSDEARDAFIDGYLESDGHERLNGSRTFTTTSEKLALGLQRLYSFKNIAVSVQYQKRPPFKVIEGRIVNQRDTYNVVVPAYKNRLATVYDDQYLWIPLKDIDIYDTDELVYNLDVDEEHTYQVQNIVNHNCHCLFQFYVREIPIHLRGSFVNVDTTFFDDTNLSSAAMHRKLDAINAPKYFLDCQLYQRSCDTSLGLPYNIASYVLLTMMIAQCTNMVHGEFIHTFGDLHIYKNHIEKFEEQLTREPYPLPTMKINPNVKDIFSFKFEDFDLIDYKSHPKIEYEISI